MKVKDLEFKECYRCGDYLSRVVLDDKSVITVLDRGAGYKSNKGGVETGYRDPEGNFWLASGMFNIREYSELTIPEAIELIKQNANVCTR